jgi:hypothetical protein
MKKVNYDYNNKVEKLKNYLKTKDLVMISEDRNNDDCYCKMRYRYKDSLISIIIMDYDEDSLSLHYKYNDYENNNNYLDSPTIEFSVQEIPAKMVHFERIMKKSFNFFIKMLKLYKDKYIR